MHFCEKYDQEVYQAMKHTTNSNAKQNTEQHAQGYDHTSIFENVSLNLLMTMIGYLFSAVTVMYASRALQPEAYGKVAFASTIVSYFSLFANLGMPIYGMRYCAMRRNDLQKLSEAFWELFTLSVTLALLSLSLLVGLIIAVPQLRENRTLILVLSATLIFNSLGCEWLYKGLEQYRYMMAVSIISRAVSILGILLFVKTGNHYLRYGVLLVLSTAGADLLRFLRICKYVNFNRKKHFCVKIHNLKKHIRPMLTFFLMACAVSVYSNLDLAMLGFMRTEVETGLYSLTYKAKILLVAFGGVLWTTMLPRAAESWSKKETERFHKLAVTSIASIYALQIPVTVFCLLFAKDMLLLLGGNSYLSAAPAFRITMLSVIPIGLSNILGGQVLIPAGLEKRLLTAELYGAVINFGLNLIFIPLFSIEGAACTTVLSEVTVWLICHYYTKKDLHMNAGDGKIPLKILIATLSGALCAALLFYIDLHPILRLILGACVFGLVHCSVAVLIHEPNTYDFLRNIKWKLKWLKVRLESIRIQEGEAYYHCPCCSLRFRKFVAFPYWKEPKTFDPKRYQKTDNLVICPYCNSLPRHRILVTWMQEHYDELMEQNILHFAQERSIRIWMDKNHISCRTADLYTEADLRLNLEDTGLPASSETMIICNHVLEHVNDYHRALCELHRILAADGQIILSFPVDPELEDVLEDRSIVTEAGRMTSFGQSDHQRIFGKNTKKVLEEHGFHVDIIDGSTMSPNMKPVVGPADYDSNILFLLKKRKS